MFKHMHLNDKQCDIKYFIQNQNCFGINKLEPRANSIPSNCEGVYYKNKEESELLFRLTENTGFHIKKAIAWTIFLRKNTMTPTGIR